MAASPVIWYARHIAGDHAALTAYTSHRFPDGTLVDLTASEAGDGEPLWQARFDPSTGRLLQVDVPLCATNPWYVETTETAADPPAVNLIAFDSSHFPPGAVVGNDIFEPLDLCSEEQVGAVRWWPVTGQIHQVYVHPRRRRQRIGTALIYAASAHLLASGSPKRIWAGGDRTELGDALAGGLQHPQRVEQLRRLVPPMTPEADAAGVPSRNLVPEP